MTLLFYTLVLSSLMLFFVWFFTPTFNVRTTFGVVLVCWAYYSFSVPLDLLLGMEVDGSFLLPDLSEKPYFEFVVKVFLYHLLFLGGYVVAYSVLGGRTGRRAPATWRKKISFWHIESDALPPAWVPAVLILAFTVLYRVQFETMHRGAIAEQARITPYLTLFSLLTSIALFLGVTYMVKVKDPLRSLQVVVACALASLVLGERTLAVLSGSAYVVLYGKVSSIRGKLILGAAFLLLAYGIKVVHVYVVSNMLMGDSERELLSDLPPFTFSGLESKDAIAYFVYFLEKGESPYWGGKTYTLLTAATAVPRFLFGEGSMTLAQEYGLTLHPGFYQDPHMMGFSALAEAWLNFGHFGPLLIGCGLGFVCRVADRGQRGLLYYPLVFFCIRFFRSDFASAFKSWFLVGGISLFLAYLILLSMKPAMRVIRGAAERQHQVVSLTP